MGYCHGVGLGARLSRRSVWVWLFDFVVDAGTSLRRSRSWEQCRHLAPDVSILERVSSPRSGCLDLGKGVGTALVLFPLRAAGSPPPLSCPRCAPSARRRPCPALAARRPPAAALVLSPLRAASSPPPLPCPRRPPSASHCPCPRPVRYREPSQTLPRYNYPLLPDVQFLSSLFVLDDHLPT